MTLLFWKRTLDLKTVFKTKRAVMTGTVPFNFKQILEANIMTGQRDLWRPSEQQLNIEQLHDGIPTFWKDGLKFLQKALDDFLFKTYIFTASHLLIRSLIFFVICFFATWSPEHVGQLLCHWEIPLAQSLNYFKKLNSQTKFSPENMR